MITSYHSGIIQAFLLLVCMAIISTVSGCGQTPFGQERTVNFNVVGFTVPSAMAYSTVIAVHSQVPQISRSEGAAMALVRNLLMQAVNDVLEERGRSEGLPSLVVSAILAQLTVQVNYTPVMCAAAYLMAAQLPANAFVPMGCFIIGDTVTARCVMGGNIMCDPTANPPVNVEPVPQESLRISGSVRTTNLIMANWTTQMWQNVFNRVLQSIRRGPFGRHFAGASVTAM